MVIKCWGARGSIAVSGIEYQKYGGDTTCLEIRNDHGDLIIVDAGTGIRALGNVLVGEPRREFNLIFTHAHWDHLLGFPFFKPIYIGGTTMNLFGCPFAQQSVKDLISKTMSPPYFPVQWKDLSADFHYEGLCDRSFRVHSIEVVPILLNHPNQGMGYKFTENGKSFVFLTDNELLHAHPGGLRFSDYADFCAGVDLLIHDAEFTEDEYQSTKGWGHSAYTHALRLAVESNAKRFGLFHHNQDHSDDVIDGIIHDCHRKRDQWKSSVDVFGVASGMEITL